MRYTDRSRIVLDWTCRRARYWGYEYQSKGLAPQTPNKDLAFGIAMAEVTANIKLGKPWSLDAFSPSMKDVGEALGLGYEHIIWPGWLKEFDLVEVEAEKPKRLAPELIYNSRPDTVMRRKSDGSLWYGPEDKTTAWVDSLLNYAKDIQLHATALCLEEVNGEPVAGALVQGLYKGFIKEEKLYHPLVWAYYKEGLAGIVPDQWSTKWVRGWERANTATYPGGRLAWIKKQTESVIAECFPCSPPIMLRRDLAESYFAQTLLREQEIAEAAGSLSVFSQNFSQCDQFSKGRSPCQFKDLCWSPTAQKYPLSLYKFREPHHPEGEK